MTKTETVALIAAMTYSFFRNGPNGGHRECAENALEIYNAAEFVCGRDSKAAEANKEKG